MPGFSTAEHKGTTGFATVTKTQNFAFALQLSFLAAVIPVVANM